MREKIYFIISSIIGIINLIYLNIFKVDDLINSELASLKGASENITSIISNHNFYYTFAIIGIILFLGMIIFASKNQISKHRAYFVNASTIIFFTSSSTILFLIPIINLFMLRNIPKEEKLKKEMPILTKNEKSNSNIIKSAILMSIYIFVNFILGDIIRLFIQEYTLTFTIIFNLATDIILLFLTISLFYQEFVNSFKTFFENIQSYSQYLLKKYGILLLANIGVSLIIALFTGEISQSQNEVSLNTLPLWYLFPAAIIYAPIVEEYVFRGCLRNLIPNDKVFIIISGISFGLLHTVGQEATLLNTFIYALPYMAMGIVLATTYVKTNNISTNIILHSANNFLSCLLRLF